MITLTKKQEKYLRNQTVSYKYVTKWLLNKIQHMRRDVFQAITDPVRRSIIDLIAKEPLNLNSVAENIDISRPAISKHIRILTECGLIIIKQQGRERYCQPDFEKLKEVADWVEQYQAFWSKKLSALENFLAKEQKQKGNKS